MALLYMGSCSARDPALHEAGVNADGSKKIEGPSPLSQRMSIFAEDVGTNIHSKHCS